MHVHEEHVEVDDEHTLAHATEARAHFGAVLVPDDRQGRGMEACGPVEVRVLRQRLESCLIDVLQDNGGGGQWQGACEGGGRTPLLLQRCSAAALQAAAVGAHLYFPRGGCRLVLIYHALRQRPV